MAIMARNKKKIFFIMNLSFGYTGQSYEIPPPNKSFVIFIPGGGIEPPQKTVRDYSIAAMESGSVCFTPFSSLYDTEMN